MPPVSPRWTTLACDDAAASALADALKIAPIVAKLLCQRGLGDPAEAARFLNPSLAQLNDPLLLADMRTAVQRIMRAIAAKERIAIHGDYDVDGVTSTVILRRALELLDTVGLAGSVHTYPHELSGGMRHRAAFARVLINRPRLLLMDEPFGALDAITRVVMQRFLLELWQRERITIIFVTHDVEEATLLGDRVCVMSGSPGRTRASIEIDLPRPRTIEDTETLEFVRLKRQIRQTLEGEHE